jgi:hypothetical protein
MALSDVLFIGGAAYMAYWFVRALVTGKAPILRNRPPATRTDNPVQYWTFTLAMAAISVLILIGWRL